MSKENENQFLLELIVEKIKELDKKIDTKITDSAKKIDDSLEDVNTKLNAQHITLIRNTESLEAHMKRTTQIEEQLKPMKFWFDGLKFSAKVIAGLGVLAATIAGVYEVVTIAIRHHS